MKKKISLLLLISLISLSISELHAVRRSRWTACKNTYSQQIDPVELDIDSDDELYENNPEEEEEEEFDYAKYDLDDLSSDENYNDDEDYNLEEEEESEKNQINDNNEDYNLEEKSFLDNEE
jgi:hypothetical protein